LVSRKNLKSSFQSVQANILGKRIRPKVLVIESDDWGSIRTSSSEALNLLGESYPEIFNSDYLKYDSLENRSDLLELYEVLRNHRDCFGEPAKMTANTVVANPDFERIKESDFKNYYYRPFTDALELRDGNNEVYELYKQGIKENLFFPQFHGREHVNTKLWLTLLEKDKMFQDAFNFSMWGISKDIRPDMPISIQATYDTELGIAQESVTTGLHLFKELFGYESKSFIANNFVWDPRLEKTLSDNGVEHIQGMKYQFLPLVIGQKRKRIRHWQGQTNKFNQTYGIRNCNLEIREKFVTVETCLEEVAMAFAFNKPAIVSIHRFNLMGGLDSANRERGLTALDRFLSEITKRYPDIQFKTTPELHLLLKENKSENSHSK